MKATIKILILLLAIAFAIGGVMIYAKTIVAPPITLKKIDQYQNNLQKDYDKLSKVKSEFQTDSIYAVLLDRIHVYKNEDKLATIDTDNNLSKLIEIYLPLFTKHSFSKFQKPVWHVSDHNMMLNQIKGLKTVRYSDKTPVLSKVGMESLDSIDEIIVDYRKAWIIGRSTSFSGIANAKSIINQATMYANKNYLPNCVELLNSLNSVRGKIAQSHYDYITNEVNKLNRYEYFSRKYYDDTLVPFVDNIVTDYDNNANTLYGSKKDVNALWSKARSYYNDAINYYTKNEY